MSFAPKSILPPKELKLTPLCLRFSLSLMKRKWKKTKGGERHTIVEKGEEEKQHHFFLIKKNDKMLGLLPKKR